MKQHLHEPRAEAVRGPSCVLIVGATGTVGRAVFEQGLRLGLPILGTSRIGGAGKIQLSLGPESNPAYLRSMVRKYRVSHCVLSAGVGGFRHCEANPDETSSVNVVGLSLVVRELSMLGVKVLYISSNSVFGCQLAPSDENAVPAPQSQYGKQKAEAESIVLSFPTNQVLRITKLVSSSALPLSDWSQRLRRGAQVSVPSQVRLAPLREESVGAACLRLVLSCDGGVYHLSPRDDMTFFEAAQILASHLRASDQLVVRASRPMNPQLGLCSGPAFLKIEKPMPEAPRESSRFILTDIIKSQACKGAQQGVCD